MRKRFAAFAWAVLGFNLLVILWGALVRASKSGEGCGDHWPLCNGAVIPHAAQIATIIEFTHRASTGIAFFGVVVMAIWAWRARLDRSAVRMAFASLAFIVMEALLGAGLVLFKYTGQDASAGRAIYLSAHLVNTMLMLAAMALTAWYGAGHRPIDWRGPQSRLLAAALFAMLAVGVTGAITALSDTLYPATSLQAGLKADFSGTAPALVRLRVWHPLLAVCGGLFVAIAAVRLRGYAVAALVAMQIAAGFLNFALLTPVWMQLVHLIIGDALWIALVLLTAKHLEQKRFEPAQGFKAKLVARLDESPA